MSASLDSYPATVCVTAFIEACIKDEWVAKYVADQVELAYLCGLAFGHKFPDVGARAAKKHDEEVARLTGLTL